MTHHNLWWTNDDSETNVYHTFDNFTATEITNYLAIHFPTSKDQPLDQTIGCDFGMHHASI